MSRPSAIRPSVLSEVQPQSLARETPISTAERPAARISAPDDVDAPGRAQRRLGHEADRRDRGDDAHRGRDPEDPVVAGLVDEQAAERQADRAADARRSRPAARCRSGSWCSGNSSRTIPNESGKTPPPTPCSTRPTIISSSPLLSAHSTEPAANAPSETARKRSLPNMSPRRPEHRRRDRRGEEVRADHPGDVARADAERVLHRGQRRDHRRLREREGERADREDGERDVVVLAVGVCGHGLELGKRRSPTVIGEPSEKRRAHSV